MRRSSISRFKFLPALFVAFSPIYAFAAACCGGGFAAPAILSGEDKAQLTTSYSYSQVVVDNVDAGGFWRKWNEHQAVETFRVEGAHLLSDRWQMGLVVPVVRRGRLGKNYSGMGDIVGSAGYEYLPDWDYNPWRPRGIAYLSLTFPTGKSRAESEVGGLDSRGNGFWAVGLGTLLTKAWGAWDIFTNLEAHRSLEKNVSNFSMRGNLQPGYGGSFSVGGGYSLSDWRLGTSLAWSYEDPIAIRNGAGTEAGSLERYATVSLSLSYLASESWAGTLSYADQTWIGSPVNTSLGRSGSLQLQRRWGR